jgi:hypothetical protein
MGLARMQLRKYCNQGLAETLAKNPLVGLLEHRIRDNKNPDNPYVLQSSDREPTESDLNPLPAGHISSKELTQD